jgi:hypothetical protein
MYTNFRIQNFRGFKDFELKDIKRVNLIAGKNNVGKTALLEALFMFGNPYNPDLTWSVYSFRGINQFKIEFGRWVENPFDSMFHNFDANHHIHLNGFHNIHGSWNLTIRVVDDFTELNTLGIRNHPTRNEDETIPVSVDSYKALCFIAKFSDENEIKHYMLLDNQGGKTLIPIPPTPKFQTVFNFARGRVSHDIDAERFTTLRLRGKQDLLLKALQIIEPRLTQIELLKFSAETILHGDIGLGRPIPLPLLGDGISRITSLILALAYAPDGIIVADEIENGLHYSVQKDVWKAIDEASKAFNVQIFATTHSREMAMAAHEAFKDSESYDFKYYRLDRDRETHDIEAVAYSERIMEAAEEMDAEVRG